MTTTANKMEAKMIESKLEGISKKLTEQNFLQREILNLPQAAEYLSISRSHLYKLTSSRNIPFFKPAGKKIFFKKEDLNAWMLKNRSATSEELERMAANHLLSKHK